MEPIILLVEDSQNDALLLEHALEKAGLAKPLQVVRDGVDAMSYLLGLGDFADRQRHPAPNILIIDLNLPRLNGLELLAWLRTQPDLQHLMVVVLSGSARKQEVNKAYHMGAKSYLVKPAKPDQLQPLADTFYRYWVVHNHLPDAVPGKDLSRDLGKRWTNSPQKSQQ